MLREIVIANDLTAISMVQSAISSEIQRHQLDADASFALGLGLSEALANAYHHGNRCDPSRRITVRYRIDAAGAEIEIQDEGEGFEPNAVPDCTADDRLCHDHGRGVMLMKQLLDEVEYREGGTCVRLLKRCDAMRDCASVASAA